MAFGWKIPGTGQRRGISPVLLVLLVAAVVPAACVLWFMNAAMANVRLAVRQRLTDVYRQKLETDRNEIVAFWSSRTHDSGAWAAGPRHVQQANFQKIAASGLADSVIMLDGSGNVAYPDLSGFLAWAVEPSPSSDAWQEARRLELDQKAYPQAAEAYGRLARQEEQADLQARAMLAQARCLAKSGKTEDALRILLQDMSRPSTMLARDSYRRSLWLDSQLYALEVMAPGDSRLAPLARRLAAAIVGDDVPAVPGGSVVPATGPTPDELTTAMAVAPYPQRIAAMQKLASLAADVLTRLPFAQVNGPKGTLSKILPPEAHLFQMLAAEELAIEYLQAKQPPPQRLQVTATAQPGLWQMASADGRLVLLFREQKLTADLKEACKLDEPFAGITTKLLVPGERGGTAGEPFLAVPASEYFPGWQLAAYLDEDPFATSADKAESAYLATGIAATAGIALLAAIVASYLGRQIRLTRLKNDFLATVSHELKTPLASMRVLVDTLREGRCPDPATAADYFDLIARENERLSRLIDSFLTFSRMERNKRAFDFASMDVGEVVRSAVTAVGERFRGSPHQLTVDVATGLPPVMADHDALQTVILNLLDNAWKYSGDHKTVAIRAFTVGQSVCIEVSDNGIGLSRMAMRRIFDKFYQVDQTLSRKTGGCGLGLSIVKFILDAHGGRISVKSQPGRGSTFTIRLPAIREPAAVPASR